MIIGAIAFLLVVSALTFAAAWAADGALRRLGRPTRWIWLVSIAAPFVLLLLPAVLPGTGPGAADGAVGSSGVFVLPGLVVGDPGGSTFAAFLPMILAVGWMLSSVVMAAALCRAHRSLMREREGWSASTVAGRDVFVSSDRGPAVAGVLRPWIVLPRWALSLPRRELDFVVLHEEEHVRARDTQLLAGSLFFVVLAPWNPFAWLHLRGLKTAMEVDCDRRVLRREPDRESYGGSLISVAEHASGLSLGLAAFTEKRRSLKTRILAMTDRHTRWTPLRSLILALVAVVVGVGACYVESPILIINGDEEDAAQIIETLAPSRAGSEGPAVEESTPPPMVEPAPPEVTEPEPPADLDEVVLEETRLEPTPESSVPPEPAQDLSAEPTFTPFTSAPRILNRQVVVEAMNREYPPLLRDAGVGGTAVVYFFIDEGGRVGNTRLNESSGHEALDRAALAVADVYRFGPAQNRGEPVPAWVMFPITFQVH